LADDIVERVRRSGRAAVSFDPTRHPLDDLQIHVGGAQRQVAAFGPQQNVLQNRDRGAALDDALDVAQRLKEGGPFDGELHGCCAKVGGSVSRPTAAWAKIPARLANGTALYHGAVSSIASVEAARRLPRAHGLARSIPRSCGTHA